MSGISFMGSYSGIDRSTIDQLMQVERLPLKQYNTKKASITEQQNAWKDINTRLNTLFGKINALKSLDTFASMKATSTNEDMMSVSASNNAATGIYRINVEQLATNSSIIGGQVLGQGETITTELNLTGAFTIENADNQKVEVTIETGDSLKAIMDKINGATTEPVGDENGNKIGITASIINGRLVLTDENMGERNISLNQDNDGPLNQLGLSKVIGGKIVEDDSPFDISFNKGKNSIFTINDIRIDDRSSNEISDVLEGLTITLNKAHESGQYDTVTVGLDNGKAESAIKDFVDQYNSTMKFIEEKLAAGDPEVPGSAGALSGDGSLMRLHSSLRNLVTSRVNANEGEFSDISQLGVSTKDRFGELEFDAIKLREALAEDPDKVMNFFFARDDENNEIGFVAKVNGYIDSFISTSNGIIKSKNETYDKTIKDINRQIEAFEARMVKKEEQLVRRFTALDVAMMQAESQMTWLQGQVDAMNGIKR